MKWLRYLSLLVFATICNGCLDVLMMSINVNDMAILNIQIVHYCCNIYGISKSEAVNLLQNAGLT